MGPISGLWIWKMYLSNVDRPTWSIMASKELWEHWQCYTIKYQTNKSIRVNGFDFSKYFKYKAFLYFLKSVKKSSCNYRNNIKTNCYIFSRNIKQEGVGNIS